MKSKKFSFVTTHLWNIVLGILKNLHVTQHIVLYSL